MFALGSATTPRELTTFGLTFTTDAVLPRDPRQTRTLDAAIETIGTAGMRGLTHRAVDDAAGLPRGSTSNHYRSRDELLVGVAKRFAERERAAFEAARTEVVVTQEDLGRTIGRFAIESTRDNRSLTLARYSLLVEAAMHPTLQQRMRDGGAAVNVWGLHGSAP